MNTQVTKTHTIVAIAALAIIVATSAAGIVIVSGGDDSQSPKQQVVSVAPKEQTVEIGSDATFSVAYRDGWTYQWLYNGFAASGQTNSSLTIANVQTNDVGNYSCIVNTRTEIIVSSTASLQAFTILDPDPIVVVYALPVVSSGGSGTCPGPYKGYVNYYPSSGWGWAPAAGTNVYTATDTNRTNTKVQYLGEYGDNGCAETSVTIPYPATSPEYVFTTYFTNNVPTNSYPLLLSGFNP
jgi:hypothetical protein